MSDERDPRDPALDAAWRAHSTETPPAALDRTILAAAHRAVGSAPRSASPAARRPWRWWMPLAAAATIGAIAIGVLQTLPPEPDETRAVASDMPAPSAAREEAAAPAMPPSAPAQRPIAPPEPSAAERKATPAAPEQSAPAGARPAPAVASPPRPAAPPRTLKSEAPREDAGAGRGVDDASTQRAPEPFPARKEGAREAIVAAPVSPGTMAEPADAPAPVPPPPVAAAAARPPNDPASGPTADRQQSATGSGDRAVTAGAARRSVAGGSPLGKSIAGAEPAPPREPDAWIARIRALHAAGNLEEAARELAAFRAAYRDADARLPESLRAWAATIRR